MATTRKHKNNLIVSYKNLTDDLKEKFKEAYPEGYSNYLQKFVKPNGEAIFVVPFETVDTVYMVKFEVKIDTLSEDLEKALFDDDDTDGKEEEFAPLSEALEKEEENTSHRERHLRHGDFEDMLDEEKKHKASLGVDKEGLKAVLGDDDEEAEELDSYTDYDDNEPSDDDFEPSDEDLRGIEDEFLDAEIPPLDATIPESETVKAKPAKASGSKSAKAASSKTAKATGSKTAKASGSKTAKATGSKTAKPSISKKKK